MQIVKIRCARSGIIEFLIEDGIIKLIGMTGIVPVEIVKAAIKMVEERHVTEYVVELNTGHSWNLERIWR